MGQVANTFRRARGATDDLVPTGRLPLPSSEGIGSLPVGTGSSVALMSRKKSSLKHLPKKALPGSGGVLSWTKTVVSSSIKKTFNLPVILNEQTATVSRLADITSAEAFDGDPVALLDSDNLRVHDSIGTRGM